MRVGRVIYAHATRVIVASVWYSEVFNLTQGLGHTRLSSQHSLVTRVQLQSVEHNHSGVTASCSTVLRVVQSDLQDTTDIAG